MARHPRLLLAGGREVDLNGRDAAMLALLALDGPQPRERVAALLWPDSSELTARNSLRQRLFNLRKLAQSPIIVGNATLQLASGLRHDLDGASQLLGGLQLPECPELDLWLRGERERLREQKRESLARQIESLEAACDYGVAVGVAQELLRIDPLSEDAHRRLIRLHYLRGDRAAAMLAFDQCAQVLKDEVGAAPSAPTMQLLDCIQRSDARRMRTRDTAVPPSILRPPRMIGREALRQQICADLTAGTVVAVTGEAGMGKSRMLAEVGADFGRYVGVAARPGDTGVPFASLARLLREILHHQPELLNAVPRSEIARFMPEFGPAAPGNQERQRLVLERAVRGLVEAASQGLDCLGFEDLHFADEASLDMLQALTSAAERSPVSWLLALRPAEAGSRTRALLDALADAGQLAEAVLQPLSAAHLSELVDSLDLPELHGAELAAALYQQSGGNPLFALETLKRMVLDLPAHGEAGRPEAASQALVLPRPASVVVLIERRLTQLSARALAVARVAAIAGMDFDIDVAEFVLEQPALLLADAWHELEQAQVLRDSAFAHDLVFETVLQGIPAPIARHTHARVATYLARQGGQAARIASHWLQAERPQDALGWLKRAAEDAGRALRTKEQVDFLLRAADIEEQQGDRSAAFCSLNEALMVEGKAGTSLDLALGARLASLATTVRERAQAGFVQLRQYAHQVRPAEAVALGEPALELALSLNDDRLVNLIRPTLGYALFYCDRGPEAIAMMGAAQAWIDAEAPVERQIDFHGNLAIILDASGRLTEAQPHHERAIDDAQRHECWSLLATLKANYANSRYVAGDIRQAIDLLCESERLFGMYEAQDAAPAGPANSLAAFYRVVGRFEDALAWARTTLERATASNSASFSALARVRHAEIYTDLGQFARAVHELDVADAMAGLPSLIREQTIRARARLLRCMGEPFEQALEALKQLLPANGRVEIHHRMALDQVCLVPPLQALAMTERVIEEARAAGHEGTVMAAYARRAACLWRHDPALARLAARRAMELAANVDSPALYRPEVWLHAALALRASGHEAQAQAQLAVARDWVMRCVREKQVPEHFVDSFLHRNPINREVLNLLAG